MRRILKNAPAKSAIIFFSQLLRFFLTFRSAYATICSVANRIIICSNISALPKMLAKASMRNTNFKKYAGLFRRPPNVANRIRLRRAASNAHVFNKFHTQAYFGDCRMLRTGFVFDEPLRTPAYSTKFHTQAYRSGHNEAVLKTVRPKATGVRIPQPAPIKMVYSLWVDLFLLPQ